MTQPAAASKNAYGDRVYRVANPGTGEIQDLVSVSVAKNQRAAPMIARYKERNIVRAVALRPDLQMLAAAGDVDEVRRQVDDMNREASNMGTAVHTVTEHDEEGVLDEETVNAPLRPYLTAYRQLRETFGWTMVAQEQTVVNFTLGYAGSFDLAALFPANSVIGEPHVAIADKKTGKGVWADVAVQLSAYANGEFVWTPAKHLPDTDRLTAELEHNIATGENVPSGRRKWSQEAVRDAQKEIAAVKDAEAMRLGVLSPMPEGMRTDIAYVIHWAYDDHHVPTHCDLYPIHLGSRLDGAFTVVAALSDLHAYKSGPERGAVGKPLVPGEAKAAPDPVAEVPHWQEVEKDAEAMAAMAEAGLAPATKPPGPTGAVLPTVTVAPGVPAEPVKPTLPERTPELYRQWLKERVLSWEGKGTRRRRLAERWPDGIPTFKSEQPMTDDQLDQLREIMDDITAGDADERSCEEFFVPPVGTPEAIATILQAFPGSEEVVPVAERQGHIDRIGALKADHPPVYAAVVQRMKDHGLAKNLRTAAWTANELGRLSDVLDSVEKEML